MWRKLVERLAVGIDTKVAGPNPKRGAFFMEWFQNLSKTVDIVTKVRQNTWLCYKISMPGQNRRLFINFEIDDQRTKDISKNEGH